MKRVFRIQGQGKVKDVGLRGLSTEPSAEDVDSTVALIQALICDRARPLDVSTKLGIDFFLDSKARPYYRSPNLADAWRKKWTRR